MILGLNGLRIVLYLLANWHFVHKVWILFDASTDTSLWHRRLGHMSEKGMKMLLLKGKLPELKSIDFYMCESCILGK